MSEKEEQMNNDQKLKKICDDFLLLDEKQQDYVLGILEALVFAKDAKTSEKTSPPKTET